MPKVPSLKQIRASRFITQAELAELAQVSRITIARLETGVDEARFSTIKKLAAALKVEPQALVQEPSDR